MEKPMGLTTFSRLSWLKPTSPCKDGLTQKLADKLKPAKFVMSFRLFQLAKNVLKRVLGIQVCT
jgi:hypothetical protein